MDLGVGLEGDQTDLLGGCAGQFGAQDRAVLGHLPGLNTSGGQLGGVRAPHFHGNDSELGGVRAPHVQHDDGEVGVRLSPSHT